MAPDESIQQPHRNWNRNELRNLPLQPAPEAEELLVDDEVEWAPANGETAEEIFIRAPDRLSGDGPDQALPD